MLEIREKAVIAKGSATNVLRYFRKLFENVCPYAA